MTERLGMKVASVVLSGPSLLSAAQKLARLAQRPFAADGELRNLPGPLSAWTHNRDLRAVAAESFRDWWARRETRRGDTR
jgi:L-lactate dehydrogenase complex protein LldF